MSLLTSPPPGWFCLWHPPTREADKIAHAAKAAVRLQIGA
jgi:hypothetical protein